MAFNDLTVGISALASAIACELSDNELALASAILVQLGDTLDTILQQRNFCKKD